MSTELVDTAQQECAPLMAQANAIVVANRDQAESAAALLGEIAAAKQRIDLHHDPTIKAAHRVHKEALTAKKTLTGPLDEAKKIIQGKVGAWQAGERRKELARVEAERKAQEEERRKVEAERAESERLRAELVADAEAAGNADMVEALSEEPEPLPEPVAPPKAEKTHVLPGVRLLTRWHAEVVDASKIPRGFLMINQPLLDSHARELKGSFDVAGCRAVETHGSATG